MNQDYYFYLSVVVFVVMIIGIYFTYDEFKVIKSNENKE